MRLLTFLLSLIVASTASASAGVYISPLSVGIMNSLRSSGEPGVDSSLTLGGEVFVERNQILFGLKYDHIENSWEGDAAMAARNKMDLALLQVGYKFLTGQVSPYVFTGGGAFFQTVYSRMLSEEEANSTVMFGYKMGLGVIARFSDNWGANLAVHFYPQSFMNGFNYILSVGFVL